MLDIKNKNTKSVIYSYLAIFFIICATIAIAAYQYHKNFEKNLKANVENQLSIIADLKIGELEHWLGERKGDAETIFGNKAFSATIKSYFKNPNDLGAKNEIEIWLKEFKAGFQYDAVFLTDPQFNRRISISDEPELSTTRPSRQDIDSLKSNRLVFADFYFGKFKQRIFLKVYVPIIDNQKLIAIVELRIDPKTYLYPILSNWPAPSETSEMFIVRRDGNEVVYLNELRFQKNSAMKLRSSLNDTIQTAVRGVMGYQGFVEGKGYRGNKVVSYIKKVPNSTWYLVAQTDADEVYAPHKRNHWLTLLISFGLFLIVGMGLGFIWRNQRLHFFKEKLKSAEELKMMNLAINNSQDIVFLTDKEGTITYINPEFTKIYGFTAQDVVGKTTPRILKSGFIKPEEVKFLWETLLAKQSIPKFEYFNKCKDGKLIQIEGSATPILNDNGDIIGFLGLQRDITLRKYSELEQRVIYEITQGVTSTNNLNELLKLIHQSLAKVLYAENIFVALYNEDTELYSFPYWVDKVDSIPEPAAMRKSWTSYVFRTGKSILFSRELFQQLHEQDEVELVGSPSPSWIGVPLKTLDRTIGVLVLQHYEKENVFSERDLQFLSTVGSQIAMAVERKLTEEAIKREMDFSQSSLDSLSGLFYLFDDQGKFLRWNKNFEKVTGYSSEEIPHLSPLNLFDEPDRTRVANKIQHAFLTGEAKLEADVLSKDKTKTPFFMTGKRFQFENKLCLVGMAIDISDRKYAEEALQNERLLLRTVIDNIPDSIYSKDVEYRKTLANRTELDYSGVNSEMEILGKTDFDLYPKELADGFFADDQMVLQNGQPVLNREEFVIDGNGQKHWLLTSKLPIKDEQGNITGLVGIGRDITERKQAEEELRESEIKLNVILQSTADGILAVDGNGKVIKTNKRFADLWHIPQPLIDSGDDNALIGFVLDQLANPDEFISKVQKLYHSTVEDFDQLFFKDGRTFERFSAPLIMPDSSIGRVWSFRDVTERTLAIEEIKNKEMQQKQIIESAGDALYLADFETKRIILTNQLACKNLGFSYEELLAKKINELDSNYNSEEEIDQVWSKMVIDNPITLQSMHLRKDGSTFPVEIRISLIIYRGRKAVLGFARDISEQIRAAQLLKDNEFKFRTFADYTVDWEYWEDENNQIVYMSPSCERLTGYSPNEFISSPVLLEKIVHPDDHESLLEHHKKSYRSESEISFNELEFRIIKKDGSVATLFHTCRPIFNEDKKFLGRRVSNSDITERKQAEIALRESEEQFRTVLETVSLIGLMIDADGRIILCNDYFLGLTGWKREDLLNQYWFDIYLPPETNKELMADYFQQAIKKGKISEHSEFEIITSDGERRLIAWNSTILHNQFGMVSGVATIGEDITARKNAEKEILEANQQLLKINNEKDKFFSIIAHDLRSPFSGFLGLTKIMAEELPSLTMAEIQDLAVSMKNSATNLYALLENLLKWSLVQQGSIPFNLEKIQLLPMISECLSPLAEPARNKGVDLSITISENTEVKADQNMLDTVVRNLVSNALKFTPKGGKVFVSAKSFDASYIEISVRDTGIGMSQAMIGNLFRPDVQTGRKGTSGEPSTGLGLLLCKEFIEKHGGKIWVESEEGKGSVFYFTIPCDKWEEE